MATSQLFHGPHLVSVQLQERVVQRPVIESVVVTHSMRAARVESEYLVVRHADAQNAAAVWMIVAFFVSYISLPLIAAVFGWMESPLAALPAAIPAFFVMLLGTFISIGVFKPELRLPRADSAGARARDAIAPAVGGYFLRWAVLHHVVPGLQHFGEFGGPELLAFVGLNFVEATLFGIVLGSFTRNKWVGFALGALFHTVFAAMWCGLML